ncbi:pentapeptide repeat-containing protein [Pseudonocardia acaciae]|uniref:pentapeptide repeat-containing protein n=1 Tax=Pseudonocardia acaciae TaxID=551276 RepID=UPI001470577B|nr:pentapeptide repeat-containing protein [Pseudonocardia acaciae]
MKSDASFTQQLLAALARNSPAFNGSSAASPGPDDPDTPRRVPDLTRDDFTGANLSDADLDRTNFAGRRLVNANLAGASLRGATFAGADLTGARLHDADLARANFSRANLARADLARAHLARASLTRANLMGADLTWTSLADAVLDGVRWNTETKWPNDRAAEIRRRSEMRPDGTFRIRTRTASASGPELRPPRPRRSAQPVPTAGRNGPTAELDRLVRAFATRHRPEGDPNDLPIVVLWGSRGSGNSELLRHLRTVDDWPGPRAFLDGERLPARLRPHQVASRLAFQLAYKAEGFGRARFPRFFLGMAAVREPLDLDSGAAARDVRRDLFNQRLRNRSEGRHWLRESAAAIADVADLDAPVTGAVGLAVDGLMEITRTQRLLRGTAMTWYRDILDLHFQDPADGLVELSIQEFLGNRDSVDEVLCRAFVADLRHEFEATLGWNARRTNAVVLLDNVGTPSLSRFLGTLSGLEDNSGPLLVVAASHQRFPPAAAEHPTSWRPDALGEASISRWSAQRAARGGSRYYPVRVDPIEEVAPTAEPDRPEVRAIADRLGLDPGLFPTVAFAHRLTAGHPTGLSMVLDALRGPDGTLSPDLDPRATLGLSGPDGQGLDDRVLGLVLGPRADTMLRGVVLMALALDLSDARFAQILAGASPSSGSLLSRYRERDLWVTHRFDDGVPRPPRMHPFARRAIAHRLARPGGLAGAGLDWTRAHELLRNAAAVSDDVTATLYHDLALGRVREVATRLTALFDPADPKRWYELLLQVTAAPLARPDQGTTTRDRLSVPGDTDLMVPTRLISALQRHTDPLGDPHHDTCDIIAYELGELARKATAGAPFLIEQSMKFQQCWNRWHPSRY